MTIVATVNFHLSGYEGKGQKIPSVTSRSSICTVSSALASSPASYCSVCMASV